MESDFSQRSNNNALTKSNLDVSKFNKVQFNDENKELFEYFSVLLSLGIAEKIGENLFKATANPDTLMKIGKGVGSAVLGDKGIEKQAEFLKHGFIGITPVLLFQALSTVTGQYYLHNINKNLKSLGEKIDRLIAYQKEKDVSKLRVAFKTIEELFFKKIYDNHELGLVLSKTNEIEELNEFYNIKIQNCRHRLNEFYKKFKAEDYHLQSKDITPPKPWYDILSSDIISDLKSEMKATISVKKDTRHKSFLESLKLKGDAEKIAEAECQLIRKKYQKKIEDLEKTFRNVEYVRTQEVVAKRQKELFAILESTELFYYLELKIICDFILAQFKFLKLKILLNLEKNDKNIYEIEHLYSLIAANNLSNQLTPESKLIYNFETIILGFLKSNWTKVQAGNFEIFTEIKNLNSQIQNQIKEQEDSQKNSELYFTLENDRASYIILNK